ncbi:MAG: VanW family protein, partial [Oscillospiraceae bacterium]|nr:VanW family protein [Oscillospiraceae bacterium]
MEEKNQTGSTPPEHTPSGEHTSHKPAATPDMGSTAHSTQGKRLVKKPGKNRVPFIVATAVMVLLLAGYLTLCALGDSEKSPLPNTHVAGMALSGESWEEAGEKLSAEVAHRLESLNVEFVCEGKTYSVPGSAFTPNTEEVLAQLKNAQQGGFITRGGRFISALLGASNRNVALTLGTMPQEVLKAVEDWGDKDSVTDYVLEETDIVFTKGRTGRTLDIAALLTELEEQAVKKLAGEETRAVEVSVTTMPPAEPNLEAIRKELYAEVSEAFFDPETEEIVPSVTGRDMDVEAARAMLEKTAEGAKCRVPLLITEPEVSTESLSELLFRDVLGETTTYAYGNVARRTNVRLSAEFANGRLLMPGDVFSYANDCGPFVTERGFMAAPGYQGGKTIDMEGGGV